MNIEITKAICILSSKVSVVETTNSLSDNSNFHILVNDYVNDRGLLYTLYCLSELEMYEYLKTSILCDSKIISKLDYRLDRNNPTDIIFTISIKLKPNPVRYDFFRDKTNIFDYLIEKIERKRKLERILDL